jgi:hypothetical protein
MKGYSIIVKSNMNSIMTSYNTLERVQKPKTQYYKLKITAHSPCEWVDFSKYCSNKNIETTDHEGFKNVLTFCNVMEGYMLNEFFLKTYGARYVGYSYFFDWTIPDHKAVYKYYFNVKNKKKFKYARIKMEF